MRMLLKLSELNQQRQDGTNHRYKDLSNVFAEIKKRDLNQTVETNESFSQQGAIIPPRRNTQLRETVRLIRNRGSAEQGISETDILRDLCFSLTNTDSVLIKDYHLRPDIKVNETVKRTVAELASLGWLHHRIKASLQKEGVVRGALNLGVQEELNEYYRWIASMEDLIRDNKLNLRKLKMWSFQPMHIMYNLANLLEAVSPIEGTDIISCINAFRPDSGEQTISKLQTRLLSFLLQPLLNYIHSWVYMGQLLDTNS